MWDLLLAAFTLACALVVIYHVSDRLVELFLDWLERK